MEQRISQNLMHSRAKLTDSIYSALSGDDVDSRIASLSEERRREVLQALAVSAGFPLVIWRADTLHHS
jgi:hypothetical protein